MVWKRLKKNFNRIRPAGRQAAATAGTVAIEFALCIPFFLILVMGVTEVGFAMYQSMQVQNSVEAGMLYAAKNGWNSSGIATAVVNAAGTPGVAGTPDIKATPAPVQFCGCPNASGVAVTACNVNCANGNSPGQYVRINASLVHKTILPYPGLPLPTTLTAQSIIRLK